MEQFEEAVHVETGELRPTGPKGFESTSTTSNGLESKEFELESKGLVDSKGLRVDPKGLVLGSKELLGSKGWSGNDGLQSTSNGLNANGFTASTGELNGSSKGGIDLNSFINLMSGTR